MKKNKTKWIDVPYMNLDLVLIFFAFLFGKLVGELNLDFIFALPLSLGVIALFCILLNLWKWSK